MDPNRLDIRFALTLSVAELTEAIDRYVKEPTTTESIALLRKRLRETDDLALALTRTDGWSAESAWEYPKPPLLRLVRPRRTFEGPCPDCCNGTIVVKDTGDQETSEFGRCMTCFGDSRQ